jgi:uncharacterized protein YgiM (DUF1202 family)
MSLMKGMIRFIFLGALSLILGFSSQALEARGLCVQNSFANLRAGPGVHHEKTGQIFRYTPLQFQAKEKGWYQVKDLDGKMHWVREDLVTEAYRCVQVKSEYANLRSGPGTGHSMTGAQKADRLVPFRWIREQGAWVEVEDSEGDKVWIHRPLLWIPSK